MAGKAELMRHVSLRRGRGFATLLVLAGCGLVLCGCARNSSVVKGNLDYKPLVCNAFSRAIGIDPKSCAPSSGKTSTYPDLPNDENNARVRYFVRDYAYAQRESMRHYLNRVETYLPMVKSTIREHKLPEDLAYLVVLESGANPEARSPANALGMWQFMPATARSYGLRVDSWIDERLDPEKSTRAAMLYLKDLYGMFGCWRLALSAYNSGENKLNKVLSQEDATEYDEICTSRNLKRETKEFFPRFLAIAHIAKNPGKFGFPRIAEKKPFEPKYEFVTVDGKRSVEALARAMNISPDHLAEINPALLRSQTPGDGGSYPLRVPLGKKEVLMAKLNTLPVDSEKPHLVHVVGAGDNVHRICRRYHVERAQLAALNPDVNLRRRLRAGSRIVVPTHKIQTRRAVPNDRVSLAHDKIFDHN
jgi:membrane-bound lytic murein transglycosylase D